MTSNASGCGLNIGGSLCQGHDYRAFKTPTPCLGLSGQVDWVATAYNAGIAKLQDGPFYVFGDRLFANAPYHEPGIPAIYTPVEVPQLAGITAITSAPYCYWVILRDGVVETCGSNMHGNLGNGESAEGNAEHVKPKWTPAQWSLPEQAIAVAAGGECSGALTAGGLVYMAGANTSGLYGNGKRAIHPGPTENNNFRPYLVRSLTGVAGLAIGGGHALALHPDGTVQAWGRNNAHQISPASQPFFLEPVPVATGIRAIAASDNTSWMITNTGVLLRMGEIATTEQGEITTPTTTMTDCVFISAGLGVAHAIDTLGMVHGQGANRYGEIGDGTKTQRTDMVPLHVKARVVADSELHALICA